MMSPEDERYKIYTRRAALLVGAQGCLLATLVGRMYYLQVVESDQYQMLAEENRISVRLLAPQRGKLLDRFGVPLATNRPDYRVMLVPEQTQDVEATMTSLSHIIPLSSNDYDRINTSIKRQRRFLPIPIRDNLSWDEFARINVESPDLPGIQPDVGSTRHYPFAQMTAHLIGYVGAVSEKDMTNDALLQLPGFKIGKNGLERAFESELRGTAGNSKVEVNALGRVIRELSRDDGVPGRNVRLTVDTEIQNFASRRLGEESGSAVVMNIHTGDVIALATTPAYDPNDFNVGITTKQWQLLVNDERKPLINKCVAGQYPPGSTFKMVVALAALEAGVTTADHTIYCTGKIKFGNRFFHCWKEHGHGKVDLVGSLQHSCDIFYYDIAEKVGVDAIAAMAHRLGLGETYNIPIPGEAKGTIPTKAWKKANFNDIWHPGETLSIGIGQGYVTATPLQLAVMAARIANGNRMITPRFRLDEPAYSSAAEAPLDISQEHLDTVRAGMNAVTNNPRGTAYAARIPDPEYAMAGKTGTSQVRRISKAERDTGLLKNEQKPWNERDHALFVAYGPVAAPQYAISVVVEHGGGGSKMAAPIARDILWETLKRDPVNRPDSPGTSRPDTPLKEV